MPEETAQVPAVDQSPDHVNMTVSQQIIADFASALDKDELTKPIAEALGTALAQEGMPSEVEIRKILGQGLNDVQD